MAILSRNCHRGYVDWPLGVLITLAAVLPTPARGQTSTDTVAAVRALVAGGDAAGAVRLAERYARSEPRESRRQLLLGDAYAARMPTGRFRAIDAYRRARQLAPNEVEPPYREALMGVWLGGADGERIARGGLERVLELDPAHEDAWNKWRMLYRDPGERREMIARLRPHTDQVPVVGRVGLLLIEAEAYGDAVRLLDSALQQHPEDATWLALLAQAHLEHGDTALGLGTYWRAVRSLGSDSGATLWSQMVGIATSEEVTTWDRVPLAQRSAWIVAFWARRHPNLFANVNPRVVEHFRRFRLARRRFPLLHPLISYQRSAEGRGMHMEPSRGERQFHLRCEASQGQPAVSGGSIPTAGVLSFDVQARVFGGVLAHLTDEEKEEVARMARLRTPSALPSMVRRALAEDGPFAFAPTIFAPLGMDVRSVDSVAARVGYNLATGLDDRGIMLLRFGEPEEDRVGGDNGADAQCNSRDVERWQYPGLGWVRFARPSAFAGGVQAPPDMMFRPMDAEQFAGMRSAMTDDRTSVPAPLEFGVWTAQFRDAGNPVLVVVGTRAGLAVTLVPSDSVGWQPGGAGSVFQTRQGVLSLPVTPGHFTMLAHARQDTLLGRLRLDLTVRPALGPAVSDILLGPIWEGPAATRADMVAHVSHNLLLPRETVQRAYFEVYDLAVEVVGIQNQHRFRVALSVRRTDDPLVAIAESQWPSAFTVTFDRVVPARNESVREWLDIAPQYLRQDGRYVMRLLVTDLVSGVSLAPRHISFVIQ